MSVVAGGKRLAPFMKNRRFGRFQVPFSRCPLTIRAGMPERCSVRLLSEPRWSTIPEIPMPVGIQASGDPFSGSGIEEYQSAGQRVKLNRYLSGLLVQFLGCDCGNDESGANC